MMSDMHLRLLIFFTFLLGQGKNFTIGSLLEDESLAAKFEGGELAIFRLAPADYHRYHSPVSAVVGPTKPINGEYYVSLSNFRYRDSKLTFYIF